MRILQVSHVFLPESSGGTEVHTLLLSKGLQARHHNVMVCYRVFDSTLPEHAVVTGEFDGLPVYRLVNNFTWSQGPDFEFFDSGLDPKFEGVLDATQPDLVHFQHLGGGLSTSFPALARRRGIPSMLTLHDFWPMCYRSHLLASDERLCVGPEGGLRCVNCWLQGSLESSVSVVHRIRELGLRNALKLAPRFALDYLGLREYLPPVAYHTTRLMARDTYFSHLLQTFDILLAPSQFLRNQYILWGVAPERIRFVQNGIDPRKFEGLPRDLPLGEEIQAVYIGSILRHKGLDVLIDAFNGLAALPIRLRIYGRTDANPDVKHYAHALQTRNRNPKVTFEGGFPNHEIGRVLSAADLVIVPSILYENCPMTILEAFYAGRPVVTSDIGGMAELVQDGVNGYTFRVGDAGHLADRMRMLVANREMLPNLQRNIVLPRTMEAVTVQVEACYQELLDRRKTGTDSVRILLVVHRFPPESVGGTELYTLYLAHALARLGYDVRVLTYAHGDGREAVAADDVYEGLPVRRVRFGLAYTDNPFLEEYDNPRVARFLQVELARQAPDLVHVTHFGYLSTAVASVAQQCDIPTIVTVTDLWPVCPNGLLTRSDGSLCDGPSNLGQCVRCYAHMGPRGAAYARLSRLVPVSVWQWAIALSGSASVRGSRYGRGLQAIRRRSQVIRERLLGAAMILCPGDFLRQMLARNGYPLDRLRLAPHGIADPEALRRSMPLAMEPMLRFGYIGPLAAYKGAHLPLEAFAALGAEAPASLTYWGVRAGEGAYAAGLAARIAQTPGVTHRGPYEHACVRQVMESMDVLIMPSLCYENTPTVMYEAFASGTPVIASDQGGMRDLANAYQGGWLFPRGDAQALAALMRRLARDREAIRVRASGIRPVPDLATHVAEVHSTYQQVNLRRRS